MLQAGGEPALRSCAVVETRLSIEQVLAAPTAPESGTLLQRFTNLKVSMAQLEEADDIVCLATLTDQGDTAALAAGIDLEANRLEDTAMAILQAGRERVATYLHGTVSRQQQFACFSLHGICGCCCLFKTKIGMRFPTLLMPLRAL